MALSNYEQRVLKEIEYDLTLREPGRWFRCYAAACRWSRPVGASAVLVLLAVLVGVLAPLAAAIAAAVAAGFALGLIWGVRLQSDWVRRLAGR